MDHTQINHTLDIEPLSPELLEDYFNFFDSIEFCDHPDWSVCYCYSFHFTGPKEQWNKENNRASVISLVNKQQMKGYLAYANGSPVGWCNANNRLNYQRLKMHYKLIEPDHPRVCSIVCFVIHQDYRRKGVAHQLLNRVIEDYRDEGYEFIEAYPRRGEISSEEHYVGPPELYQKCGFEIVEEFSSYRIVRKALQGL